jgi:hypothetical protein
MIPIEDFARLSAQIDHGAAGRRAVLDAAGLDEPGWEMAKNHWTTLLGNSTEGDLPGRFATAYAATRRALLEAAPVRGIGSTPEASKTDPYRALRRGTLGYPLADPDETALPFAAGRPALPWTTSAAKKVDPPVPDAATEALLGTTAVAPVHASKKPVLPFSAPRGTAPNLDIAATTAVAPVGGTKKPVLPFAVPSVIAPATEDDVTDGTAIGPVAAPTKPVLPFSGGRARDVTDTTAIAPVDVPQEPILPFSAQGGPSLAPDDADTTLARPVAAPGRSATPSGTVTPIEPEGDPTATTAVAPAAQPTRPALPFVRRS